MNTSPTDSQTCSILVVEDSPLIRKRVLQQLSETLPGAHLEGADCIADAVEHLVQAGSPKEDAQLLSPRGSRFFQTTLQLPDVLVLDLELPGCNGLNLLRAIKREHPQVGVVVYTCLASDAVRRACLAMGADFFVSKAEDVEMLDSAVLTLAARCHGHPHGRENPDVSHTTAESAQQPTRRTP